MDAILALATDSLLVGLRKTNPWLRGWISGEFDESQASNLKRV